MNWKVSQALGNGTWTETFLDSIGAEKASAHFMINLSQREPAFVTGVDPSNVTGFSALSPTAKVQAVGVVSVDKKASDLQRISALGRAYQEFLRIVNPMFAAIELPFPGFGYRSKAIVFQSRLYQHFMDCSPALIRPESEIVNTTAKAAVLERGDRKVYKHLGTKELVAMRVCERFDLQFVECTNSERYAMCDAIAIAYAFYLRMTKGEK